jgi:hypothetical protein
MNNQGTAGLIGALVGVIGLGAGIFAVIWGLGFLEYLGGKKPSSRAPVSRTALKELLLSINSPELPYEIKTSPETDFLVEWKLADAKWFAILSKERFQEIYRGFIVLDEPRHSVRYCEEMASIRWLAETDSQPSFSYQKNFFRGRILFQKSWEVQYAIKEDLSLGKVYEYKFDVRIVRNPIQKLVRDSGWEFVPVIRKSHATFKSLRG